MRVSTELLFRRVRGDLDSAAVVDLRRLGLTSLRGVEACPACTVLVLSGNELRSLEGAQALPFLWHIYAADNAALADVGALADCVALYCLDVRNTGISYAALAAIRDVHVVDFRAAGCSALEEGGRAHPSSTPPSSEVFDAPCSREARRRLVHLLPRVWCIDGELVTPGDRSGAEEHFSEVNRAAWTDLDAAVADLATRPSEHAGTLLRLGPSAGGSEHAEELVETLRNCPMRPSLAHPWYQRHLHALYERERSLLVDQDWRRSGDGTALRLLAPPPSPVGRLRGIGDAAARDVAVILLASTRHRLPAVIVAEAAAVSLAGTAAAADAAALPHLPRHERMYALRQLVADASGGARHTLRPHTGAGGEEMRAADDGLASRVAEGDVWAAVEALTGEGDADVVVPRAAGPRAADGAGEGRNRLQGRAAEVAMRRAAIALSRSPAFPPLLAPLASLRGRGRRMRRILLPFLAEARMRPEDVRGSPAAGAAGAWREGKLAPPPATRAATSSRDGGKAVPGSGGDDGQDDDDAAVRRALALAGEGAAEASPEAAPTTLAVTVDATPKARLSSPLPPSPPSPASPPRGLYSAGEVWPGPWPETAQPRFVSGVVYDEPGSAPLSGAHVAARRAPRIGDVVEIGYAKATRSPSARGGAGKSGSTLLRTRVDIVAHPGEGWVQVEDCPAVRRPPLSGDVVLAVGDLFWVPAASGAGHWRHCSACVESAPRDRFQGSLHRRNGGIAPSGLPRDVGPNTPLESLPRGRDRSMPPPSRVSVTQLPPAERGRPMSPQQGSGPGASAHPLSLFTVNESWSSTFVVAPPDVVEAQNAVAGTGRNGGGWAPITDTPYQLVVPSDAQQRPPGTAVAAPSPVRAPMWAMRRSDGSLPTPSAASRAEAAASADHAPQQDSISRTRSLHHLRRESPTQGAATETERTEVWPPPDTGEEDYLPIAVPSIPPDRSAPARRPIALLPALGTVTRSVRQPRVRRSTRSGASTLHGQRRGGEGPSAAGQGPAGPVQDGARRGRGDGVSVSLKSGDGGRVSAVVRDHGPLGGSELAPRRSGVPTLLRHRIRQSRTRDESRRHVGASDGDGTAVAQGKGHTPSSPPPATAPALGSGSLHHSASQGAGGGDGGGAADSFFLTAGADGPPFYHAEWTSEADTEEWSPSVAAPAGGQPYSRTEPQGPRAGSDEEKKEEGEEEGETLHRAAVSVPRKVGERRWFVVPDRPRYVVHASAAPPDRVATAMAGAGPSKRTSPQTGAEPAAVVAAVAGQDREEAPPPPDLRGPHLGVASAPRLGATGGAAKPHAGERRRHRPSWRQRAGLADKKGMETLGGGTASRSVASLAARTLVQRRGGETSVDPLGRW